MTILELCERIETWSIPTLIRESATLFPLVESIHVMALAFVVGSISIVDLRLLGFASRKQSVKQLSDDLLPWTWGAFAIAAITDLLLFSSVATRYYDNMPFRWKLVLLLLAGINMLAFHFLTYRDVGRWGRDEVPPTAARVAGGVSILLWTAVVVCGRWIGFI